MVDDNFATVFVHFLNLDDKTEASGKHLTENKKQFRIRWNTPVYIIYTWFSSNTRDLFKKRNYGTCFSETHMGFINSIQITLSRHGGVVRDPGYVQ